MQRITLNTEDLEVVDTSGNPIVSFKVEEFAETGKLSIKLHSMNPDLKGAVLYPTGFVVNHPTLLGDQYEQDQSDGSTDQGTHRQDPEGT
jgi:hypothetical protein